MVLSNYKLNENNMSMLELTNKHCIGNIINVITMYYKHCIYCIYLLLQEPSLLCDSWYQNNVRMHQLDTDRLKVDVALHTGTQ